MPLTLELISFYLALIIPMCAGFVFLWNKFDQIWRAIAGQVSTRDCTHRMDKFEHRLEQLERDCYEIYRDR